MRAARRGKVNEAAGSLDDSSRLLSRERSRERSLRSTSTDALLKWTERNGSETSNFLRNLAARETTLTKSVVSLVSSFRESSLFIVVPLAGAGVTLLIEIEKYIIFAEHELPGIVASIIRAFP